MLEKKYGFWTTVSMVIGIVIGSGIFFKSDNVLMASGGDLTTSILAWLVGAVSMIFGALVFADCSIRFQKSNGIVDYGEALVSDKFGYLIGWFNSFLYYPALAAVLAWVSANYTAVLLNKEGNFVWIMTGVYIIAVYLLNYLSPLLSGKFQVISTAMKLIPLALIGLIGIYRGLTGGVLAGNFLTTVSVNSENIGFGVAVLSTAFAYEGWIMATTINSEIKDAKKTLPRALILGSFVTVIIYLSYFLGITGILPISEILSQGDNAVNSAATIIFGDLGASVLTAFVVISCLGTLNGLTLGSSRSFYSLAIRNQGIAPNVFSKLDKKTNIPTNSTLLSLFLVCMFSIVWYCNMNGLFPNQMFIDISELPIALMYVLYIIIYISYIRKLDDLSFAKRYIIPIIALLGSIIVVYGGLSKPSVFVDLGISIFVFLSGLPFYKKIKSNSVA